LNWQTCDGSGNYVPHQDPQSCAASVTRRGLMVGASMALLGWATRRSALAQVAISPRRGPRNVLVVVFLRGGADGLSLVVPHGDEAYYRLRPTLAVPRNRVHDLDGFFGLHPALSPLVPLYEQGSLAPCHAVGSDDQTRSHFEAMDTMERGVARRDGPQSGWVARYLAATELADPSPLRAVAIGHTTPTSLVGASHTTTLDSLADYQINAPASAQDALEALYRPGRDEVAAAGRQTFEVLRTLDRIDAKNYRPSHAAKYPESDLGLGLKQVACLIRADLGMEVACLDKGGWDTHFGQGTEFGVLPLQLNDLSHSLAAFAQDLGPEMKHATVIVMSEFGRRIAENASLGTDHGHGGALFALGGGVRGGKVHARWPGLDHPVGPGDLDVTTDYRDILAEALQVRMGLNRPDDVFGNRPAAGLGLFA
jgi:uncharacterized protein (DUF1501 family)